MENISEYENTEKLFRWLFRRDENLKEVVFLFISRKNAINARYTPLFLQGRNIRMVYLLGSNFRHFDRLFMHLGKTLFNLRIRNIKFYEILHVLDLNVISNIKTQALHLDDPQYSDIEISNIALWENNLVLKNQNPVLIVTNSYTKSWFVNHLKRAEIIIIEQGFHSLSSSKIITKHENAIFVCAYSSNFIHYGSDRHANDSTWGSSTLLDEVIPRISALDSEIQFRLIGELGKQAKLKIETMKNVKAFGRVGFEKNIELLMQCDIAIYPRLFDHRRSILKIFSYLGADLPIVSIDLVDTEIVRRKEIGYLVPDIDTLISKVLELKDSIELREHFRSNIVRVKSDFTWDNLALKMEYNLQKYLS